MFTHLFPGSREDLLIRVAVAIEAGVLAGLASLVWLTMAAFLSGRPVLSFPVALTEQFWGDTGHEVLVGVAIHLSASGVAGCVFALLVRYVFRLERAVVLGILAGLAVFVIGNLPLAQAREVLIVMPVPALSRLVACLLFGGVLGCYPHLLRIAMGEKTP